MAATNTQYLHVDRSGVLSPLRVAHKSNKCCSSSIIAVRGFNSVDYTVSMRAIDKPTPIRIIFDTE